MSARKGKGTKRSASAAAAGSTDDLKSAIGRLRDATTPKAASAALLQLLGRDATTPPSEEKLSVLRGALDVIAEHSVAARVKRVRMMEEDHSKTLKIEMAGVELPFVICAREIAAKFLTSKDACALARACRDWRNVIASPLSWREAIFPEMNATQFLAALRQPKFRELTVLQPPSSGKMKYGKTFFATLNKCCPSLKYFNLDMTKISPENAAQLLDTMPSPLSVKGLAVGSCYNFCSSSFSLLSCRLQNLTFLSMATFRRSECFAHYLPSVARLVNLQHLAMEACNFGGGMPQGQHTINDADFEPIVKNCTKLRKLRLANFYGLGTGTWQNLAKYNTTLTHLSLSWSIWSSERELRKARKDGSNVDFTSLPGFGHLIDFSNFATTLAELPSLKYFAFYPGSELDQQFIMRSTHKDALCQSLVDMLHWAEDKPEDVAWLVDINWDDAHFVRHESVAPVLCRARQYMNNKWGETGKSRHPVWRHTYKMFNPDMRTLTFRSDDAKY